VVKTTRIRQKPRLEEIESIISVGIEGGRRGEKMPMSGMFDL